MLANAEVMFFTVHLLVILSHQCGCSLCCRQFPRLWYFYLGILFFIVD